jgi:hypothetical protein
MDTCLIQRLLFSTTMVRYLKPKLIGLLVFGVSRIFADSVLAQSTEQAAVTSGEFEVSSSFSTVEAVIGREVSYSIQIRKGSVDEGLETPIQPSLPKSVAFSYGRFSTKEQYQSSLGNDPIGILLEFEVIPNVEGRLVMPAFSFEYMGRVLQVPAASIRVRSQENDLLTGEFEWVVTELGDIPDSLTVGQRVKTSLNLYVLEGLRKVTFGNPVPVGSDFSLDQIVPGPTETVDSRGIYRYRLYSWPLTFTPLRNGRIAIAFKTTVNFRIPNDRLEFIRSIRMGNDLGRSNIEALLMDSTEESLTVFTDNLRVSVESLDDQVAPDDFSGAIGVFELEADLDQTNLQVGEPVDLTVVVSGTGNFGAFDPPEINLDKRWRVFHRLRPLMIRIF